MSTLPPSAGVIGWPVAHSKSPLIHRFWLAKLGLDGDYGRFPVASGHLGEAIRALPALGLRGVNVTVPHKQAVIAHLDRLDPLAERVGAVNTVVVEDGALVGYNTDVAGVAEPLRRFGPPLRRYQNHVATYTAVLGAGGAARAACFGAVEAGYLALDMHFHNRTVANAQAISEQLLGLPDWGFALDDLGPIRNDDDGLEDQRYSHLIINATTMGMNGENPVPVDLSRYYPDTIIFDMVYAPLETPLLAQARRFGLRTIDGLEMLVAQAAAAFALFFGTPAPRAYDAELRTLLTA